MDNSLPLDDQCPAFDWTYPANSMPLVSCGTFDSYELQLLAEKRGGYGICLLVL